MRRIIVVDDEPDITSGIAGCLQGQFSVDAFNDPEEALAGFRRGRYDMALIDIKMPKMNGFKLHKAMYQIDPDVIYCFITAFEIRAAEFRKMFPATRVACFLRKPFSADDLTRVLEAELGYDAASTVH